MNGSASKQPKLATHLRQGGTDIGTTQDLLGHSDVSTTMIERVCRKSKSVNARVRLTR